MACLMCGSPVIRTTGSIKILFVQHVSSVTGKAINDAETELDKNLMEVSLLCSEFNSRTLRVKKIYRSAYVQLNRGYY